ncbi:MAG: hypothetical protein ABJO29_05245 [Yoonia sp.]
MLTALAACDAGFGASRIGDTILETGTLNCTEGSPQEQALVVGTEADPVRCGPQTQPIVQ